MKCERDNVACFYQQRSSHRCRPPTQLNSHVKARATILSPPDAMGQTRSEHDRRRHPHPPPPHRNNGNILR